MTLPVVVSELPIFWATFDLRLSWSLAIQLFLCVNDTSTATSVMWCITEVENEATGQKATMVQSR
jgi:hypothetical protein